MSDQKIYWAGTTVPRSNIRDPKTWSALTWKLFKLWCQPGPGERPVIRTLCQMSVVPTTQRAAEGSLKRIMSMMGSANIGSAGADQRRGIGESGMGLGLGL